MTGDRTPLRERLIDAIRRDRLLAALKPKETRG